VNAAANLGVVLLGRKEYAELSPTSLAVLIKAIFDHSLVPWLVDSKGDSLSRKNNE
jgi:hypothetical protein